MHQNRRWCTLANDREIYFKHQEFNLRNGILLDLLSLEGVKLCAKRWWKVIIRTIFCFQILQVLPSKRQPKTIFWQKQQIPLDLPPSYIMTRSKTIAMLGRIFIKLDRDIRDSLEKLDENPAQLDPSFWNTTQLSFFQPFLTKEHDLYLHINARLSVM